MKSRKTIKPPEPVNTYDDDPYIIKHGLTTNEGMSTYMDEAVWQYYSEEAQRILLHYTDAELITPEMCQHLTGDRDAAEVLKQEARLGPLLAEM